MSNSSSFTRRRPPKWGTKPSGKPDGAIQTMSLYPAQYGKSRKKKSRVAQQIAQVLAAKLEIKQVYFSQLYTQLDRNGTIFSVTPIPQGVTDTQRVGTKVTPIYLEMRANAYFTTGVLSAEQHAVRMLILRWNLDDTTVGVSIGGVLQYPGGIGDYRALVSPYNWNAKNQGDFTIIEDRCVSIASAADGWTFAQRIPLHGSCVFSGAATTGVGMIYVMFICDDLTGAHTPNVQLQYAVALHYADG